MRDIFTNPILNPNSKTLTMPRIQNITAAKNTSSSKKNTKTPKPKAQVQFDNDSDYSDSEASSSFPSTKELFQRKSFHSGIESMLSGMMGSMNISAESSAPSVTPAQLKKVAKALADEQPTEEMEIYAILREHLQGGAKAKRKTAGGAPKKTTKPKKKYHIGQFPTKSIKKGVETQYLIVSDYKGLPNQSALIFDESVEKHINKMLKGFEKEYPEYKPSLEEDAYGGFKAIIFKRLPKNPPKNSKNPDEVAIFEAEPEDSEADEKHRCRPLINFYKDSLSKGTVTRRTQKELIEAGTLVENSSEDSPSDNEPKPTKKTNAKPRSRKPVEDEDNAGELTDDEPVNPEPAKKGRRPVSRKSRTPQPVEDEDNAGELTEEEPEDPKPVKKGRRPASRKSRTPQPVEEDSEVEGDDLDLDM